MTAIWNKRERDTGPVRNIGAIGWWNYDNQGDLAMLSALRQGLAPHHVVPIDAGFPAHPDAIYRLDRLDYVLLGGGTLIRGKPTAPFDTFSEWADQLRCPLGVVGLGVDPFLEQYWPAIEALLDRAEFFYVRDKASLALLHNHPKVQVAPDLTFAYPLTANHPRPADAGGVVACGVNLRRTDSSGFDLGPWLDALAQLPVQLKGVPLSSFGAFDESVLLRQLDPTSPERFDASLYREIDLLIGAAFHSVLFAVQTAVPVIAIGSTPKVRHFMADNGLERYLLGPDEPDKLPALVSEVLAAPLAVRADLHTARSRLNQAAQRNMREIRAQVEQSKPRGPRGGPQVAIVVISSGDEGKDQRTLTSCASQTYPNVETMLIDADPETHVNVQLQQAVMQSRAEYLTWIDGGDWLADDALECLVDRLGQESGWDVAYADYYSMDEANLPTGYHTVPGPDKLYRRDVVGPCFLMRRSALTRLGWPTAGTPLVAYDLWLRLSSTGKLVPFHAPLFYSARPIRSRAFVAQEREVRRRWRQVQPAWSRTLWWAIDTDLGERCIVRPSARLLSLLTRKDYAEQG